MAEFDSESSNIAMKISKEFIEEQPKIGAAVKNLIAMVLGKSISDPSTNLLFGGDYIFTPDIGLACGKCLLQAIQRFELEEPLVWGAANPQPDDQTGENRLDDVLKYKCLYDMKARINSTKGAKISAIFGRSYLRTSKSWSAIKSTIVLPPMVYAEMFDYFLQHFENSLLLDKNDSENVMNDASLVWAVNFYEALKLRQDKRKVEAQKRLKGEAVIAARDAELSDWEDSDDENYVPKKRNEDDDDDDGGGNIVNVIIEKIEKAVQGEVVVDNDNDENLKSVN